MKNRPRAAAAQVSVHQRHLQSYSCSELARIPAQDKLRPRASARIPPRVPSKTSILQRRSTVGDFAQHFHPLGDGEQRLLLGIPQDIAMSNRHLPPRSDEVEVPVVTGVKREPG